MAAAFRIGLIGLGHVGSAFAARLKQDAGRIAQAAGRPIVLESVAVARATGRTAPAPLEDAGALVRRPGLDAVVELMGGMEPAHTYLYEALQAGKQVITANKQVVASSGPDLARLGPLRFEAAVASAIPVVEVLAATLASDRIASVTGILNGTTNVILEAMAGGGSYAVALADAQARGYAEADPSADVEGHDPAAKLTILAMLAFGKRIDPDRVERRGIGELDGAQLRDARERGAAIKLVASARDGEGDQVLADVRPRLVPLADPLARVAGPANGIAIAAGYAGHLYLEGPGAGPDAAASAVLADVIRSAREVPAFGGLRLAALAGAPAVSIVPLGSASPYPAAS
ncbi:MAG: homoserine dehydrogenase [Chloroflexi bacterium]|nr:MAG: homoserine dehydrogenase [Chloroflexota bacterium]TMG35889.1 MAG: homoserine dehydrogenase [Chloroflexota bacterium]